MSGIELTVIDLFQSAQASMALARSAEGLGYRRYWLSEQQPQPSALVVLPLVGAATKRLRVGTAGLQLRYHSAPIAAFAFRQLAGVFGPRLDAGVSSGRAHGALHADLSAGAVDLADDDLYAIKAKVFCQYALTPSTPSEEGHSLCPELWIHGCSVRDAMSAAEEGTAYGHELYGESPAADATAIRVYRDAFRSNSSLREPRVCVSVAGVCAETDDEARQLDATGRRPGRASSIVGGPARCAEAIVSLARRYGTDEIAFMDSCRSPEDTRRSYALLARALGL